MNLRGVYVDGGKIIQSFLADGLLDELTVTWIPILIGRGIPLFGRLEKDARLKLIENRAFDNGFVQTRYEILPSKIECRK
jgi:dihydrofolate reductase